MTTTYESKEEALTMGALYAGYRDEGVIKKVISEAKVEKMDLGWPHSMPAEDGRPEVKKTLDTYLIKNVKGIEVRLGVSRFREGYDLWLISPEGVAVRT